MLHYEESPEKPQYNTVIPISRQPPPHPHFVLTPSPLLPLLSSKNLHTPHFHLYEGGWGFEL